MAGVAMMVAICWIIHLRKSLTLSLPQLAAIPLIELILPIHHCLLLRVVICLFKNREWYQTTNLDSAKSCNENVCANCMCAAPALTENEIFATIWFRFAESFRSNNRKRRDNICCPLTARHDIARFPPKSTSRHYYICCLFRFSGKKAAFLEDLNWREWITDELWATYSYIFSSWSQARFLLLAAAAATHVSGKRRRQRRRLGWGRQSGYQIPTLMIVYFFSRTFS